MDEERAHLRAIATEPAEDAPRLVYADWLDEHDDHNRAEFIRIQCGLAAGVDSRTRLPATEERLMEMATREQELIELLLQAPMTGETPRLRELSPYIAVAVAVNHERISFRRGMIETLNLLDTNVSTLPPNLYIGGSFDAWKTKIRSLSPGLHVGGDLLLDHSQVTTLPPNLYVGNHLHINNTHISHIPENLYVGHNIQLANTDIRELPTELHVGGKLDLFNTNITESAARRIIDMPNLSDDAKVSGLESAGFRALSREVRRNLGTETSIDRPPRP